MAQSGTSAEVDADIGNVRRRIDRLLDGFLATRPLPGVAIITFAGDHDRGVFPSQVVLPMTGPKRSTATERASARAGPLAPIRPRRDTASSNRSIQTHGPAVERSKRGPHD